MLGKAVCRLRTETSPAISKKAMMKIKTEIRSWNLNRQTHISIEQIAERINPIVSGWMNYYTRFGKSEFWKVMSYVLSLDEWVYPISATLQIEINEIINNLNKRVKYEEPCDGRLSSTVP